MNERSGIAVAGSIIVDHIHDILSYPKPGELAQILQSRNAVGGCVPNVAIDLKRINPDMSVRAIGMIGDDESGRYVSAVLRGEHVDVSGLTVSAKESTGFTEVMSIIEGERTFFSCMGANSAFGVREADIGRLNVKMLHLGYFLLLKKVDEGDGMLILKEAQAAGIRTSIDLVSVDSERYGSVLPCLPYTDNLIINEYEAGKLSGMEPSDDNMERIADFLLRAGVKQRVIIHRPDASFCLSSGGFTKVKSYELPEGYIKGSTGAGDAFCAGALTGIYDDKTDAEILEFASQCAVMSLGRADATGGLTEKEKIVQYCSRFKKAMP